MRGIESGGGDEIRAAGGVLWRAKDEFARSVEVAVVHRQRYDDWSLPKGKLDPGEHPLGTAVREIAEETGFTASAGYLLPSARYRVPGDSSYADAGADKIVDYWAMRATGGAFEPNHEVDQLRWLPIDEATELVSYPHDREVLTAFERIGPPTATVLLVRHAKAGQRSEWTGPDADRPLESAGREQAEHLANTLPGFQPTRVLSAIKVRCVETVRPLADRLGLTLENDDDFSEEHHAAQPTRMAKRIRRLAANGAATNGTATVVSSQGGAIPESVALLAAEDSIALDAVPAKKASVWALSFSGRRLIAADYFRSLAPFA